jgi:hypothetical protein
VKYRIAVVCVFFCAASSTNAQILIGPIAGGNLSWTRFDERETRESLKVRPLIGYHAGFNISFRAGKRFFLHSSFVYSRKGKLVKSELDPLLSNRAIYNHFDIPILYTAEFKSTIGSNKAFKWYLGVGPNLSYWINGKGTLASSDIKENGIDKISYTVEFKKTYEDATDTEMVLAEPNRVQLGFNLAAGTSFEPVGGHRIMLMLRYEVGQTFLGKTNGLFPITVDYSDVLRATNNGIRISVAYLFDLKIDQRKKGKSTINKRKL